jgi:hypothetical protein
MPMQAKPEHRPGEEIRSETITLDYCRARLSDGWLGEGYRLSHSRRRSVGHGADVWIPVYDWKCLDFDLPRDGLSQWEVHQALEAMQAEAARRYQAEKQRRASRKHERMVAHREHEDPAATATVETEHYDGAAHSRIVS